MHAIKHKVKKSKWSNSITKEPDAIETAKESIANEEVPPLTPAGFDYEEDPSWRAKPLTPAQVLVNDVRLETWRGRQRGPLLEIAERSPSNLVPSTAATTPSAGLVRAAEAANNPIEQQQFAALEQDYGWMRYLRLLKYQRDAYDQEDSAKCRWIHCSSKFPEYLRGFLWGLTEDLSTVAESMSMLDHTVSQNTRYSKHGKYFAPFAQPLLRSTREKDGEQYPMLIAVPFLDWTILGATPPLRFQVDRREGFVSAKSTCHVIRSVLQYYYRLEDTSDREASQVFAKHRPWNTNRDLDLKVRQFYGSHPTALNADELWILAIDPQHIVTLSSNQTWKSRWPPVQLTSRISDVAFRNIRNAFYSSDSDRDYDAMTHAVTCLSGAVGMMHRNFWADLLLPAVDRYAGYMGHLQYRLHRAPSTKLVMDLIACQEELNIVIQITQQQLDMISELQAQLETPTNDGEEQPNLVSKISPTVKLGYERSLGFDVTGSIAPPQQRREAAIRRQPTYRPISTSPLADPIAQLLDNLQRELVDLSDLRDNADRLVTRTIQLVNIRLEDHGKAILVFTVVTIIFLPLNFVSSFFGMNFRDIRDTTQSQWVFWAVALCVTAGVLGASIFLAFSGANVLEMVHLWKDRRRETRLAAGSTAS